MPVQLAKSAVDLGVVIRDSERSPAFHCGLLGLEHVADIAMPIGGGGTMHRVQCGDAAETGLLRHDVALTAGGGISGGLGCRYVTMIVSNLDEIVQACVDADVSVAVPISKIREGVRIGIVEDPDGNWVQFVEMT